MEGYADYYGASNLHPIALAVAIVLAIAVLVVRREIAVIPLLVGTSLIPVSQRIILGGADFTILRLLLLVYLIRLVARRELRFAWNKLDAAVLMWVVAGATVMTIDRGSADAFINRLGWAYDIVLLYLIARSLIRDPSDLAQVGRILVFFSVPVSAIFMVEWLTQFNAFSVFGGVPEHTMMVEGRLRAQGPFAHPILAGVYWSAALPLMWSVTSRSKTSTDLTTAGIGTLMVLIIIFASSSSTSIITFGAVIFGASLFRFRRFARSMWISVCLGLVFLHFLIMEQPVWHLIARIDILGGSTGWHRFVVFDVFVRNFSDWYLTGYAHPMSWHWFMRDITNQYVLEGLRGGLVTLVCFVLMLGRAFELVGRTLRTKGMAMFGQVKGATEWQIWLVGVAIFAHCVTFWGISYFAQSMVIFCTQLGFVGALAFRKGEVNQADERDLTSRRRIGGPAERTGEAVTFGRINLNSHRER